MTLLFLVTILLNVFIVPKFVLIASFLYLAHNGAPTNAANGIIKSCFLTSFSLNLFSYIIAD